MLGEVARACHFAVWALRITERRGNKQQLENVGGSTTHRAVRTSRESYLWSCFVFQLRAKGGREEVTHAKGWLWLMV